MRVLSLASLGLISLAQLAASQDLSTLPSCAVTCALTAIGATGCATTDAHCICSATSFLASVQTCISTACSAADQAATLTFAQQFCLSGGVTISLPTAAAPATTPASSSAASSPASSSAPASVSATKTSSAAAPPASSAPAATFTGAANVLQQQWGVMGLLGLGVAAVI